MAKKTKTVAPPKVELAPEPVEVSNLYLDPKNPRLAEREFNLDDQVEILRVLWRELSVDEIADSIAASGYWEYEVLFAVKESGKLVVVEGNRRLAAVKLLLDADLREEVGAGNIRGISAADKEKLEQLPVVTCTRLEIWQYVGFKHVNGPQDWDSIAKAEYIADVYNGHKVPLDEIANTIGDRHDTVRRLYHGLMVLRQAEGEGLFDREDRYKQRFAYSHLWTGLGYAGVQRFLGITEKHRKTRNPVPKGKLSNLRELCLWLYGSKEQGKEPIIRSQNPDLRNLDEVLRDKDGVAALRLGLPLETSLKASRGDERLFREAMVKAEQALREARGLILTGYHGGADQLETGKSVHLLAKSIFGEMKEMHESRTSSKAQE